MIVNCTQAREIIEFFAYVTNEQSIATIEHVDGCDQCQQWVAKRLQQEQRKFSPADLQLTRDMGRIRGAELTSNIIGDEDHRGRRKIKLPVTKCEPGKRIIR